MTIYKYIYIYIYTNIYIYMDGWKTLIPRRGPCVAPRCKVLFSPPCALPFLMQLGVCVS